MSNRPGIPTNVLARRLKELEEDGLVVREARIALTDGQRRLLLARARRSSSQHRDMLRTRIVLAAADGATNAAIARDGAVGVDTVRKWRRRFSEHGWDGLRDLPRSGRPRTCDATMVAEVKAMACELPADSDTPLAKWSCPDLAAEAANRGIVGSVSDSTARRWLASDAIKPWQHRSWIFPRDPDFAANAARVLDLYARVFDGEPLGEHDYVLSADEKPCVQARTRIHPSAPARPGRQPMRVESEYRRHGTLAYLAAYDVHRAHVIGHCAPTTGIAPFTELVEKVMTSRPYASARLHDAFPNAQMVHLPVHASWQNQVEIYFSVIQRKLLTPDDFANLEDLAKKITAFEKRYNDAAHPFDWRFDRTDLHRFVDRIAA